MGQYVFYRSLLARSDPSRQLYLAVATSVYSGILSDPIARPVMEDARIALVVFDAALEVILKWHP